MSAKDHDAPHAYHGLDRVLHEKARLGILVALSSRPNGVLFPDLKLLCELTDGNLNRHLSVLAEAGLVEVWKTAESGARARTLVRISDAGRETFRAYLDELERVLEDAKSSATTKKRGGDPGPQWAPA
jgi:DNA-binding MarR family transcriptional regulator